MVPQAAVKAAVLVEGDEILPTAAATVSAERSTPSRRNGGEVRSEWKAGLTLSVVRWVIRMPEPTSAHRNDAA